MIHICDICGHFPCDSLCPNAPEPKGMGQCKTCYLILRHDYPYVTDDEGNLFCSEECAKQYHGIKEKVWEDDDE